MKILRGTGLVVVTFLGLSVAAQTSPPREHFDHAAVLYDWVTNARGEQLGTFVTRPNNVTKFDGTTATFNNSFRLYNFADRRCATRARFPANSSSPIPMGRAKRQM